MRIRRVGFAAAIAVLLATVAFSTVAFARSGCQRVYGSGLTLQSVPFVGPFEGTADLNLGEAEVSVVLLGADEKPDGTLHALTSHAFDLVDDGGFVTIDKAILAPTETPGLFNLNTRARICATEDCEEELVDGEIVNGPARCGRLSVHGTINFGIFPAEAEWRTSGKICDCREE